MPISYIAIVLLRVVHPYCMPRCGLSCLIIIFAICTPQFVSNLGVDPTQIGHVAEPASEGTWTEVQRVKRRKTLPSGFDEDYHPPARKRSKEKRRDVRAAVFHLSGKSLFSKF